MKAGTPGGRTKTGRGAGGWTKLPGAGGVEPEWSILGLGRGACSVLGGATVAQTHPPAAPTRRSREQLDETLLSELRRVFGHFFPSCFHPLSPSRSLTPSLEVSLHKNGCSICRTPIAQGKLTTYILILASTLQLAGGTKMAGVRGVCEATRRSKPWAPEKMASAAFGLKNWPNFAFARSARCQMSSRFASWSERRFVRTPFGSTRGGMPA